jgi:hypothetical protein
MQGRLGGRKRRKEVKTNGGRKKERMNYIFINYFYKLKIKL